VKNKGLTLIEFLIVIVIFTVLAGVLIGGAFKAIEIARIRKTEAEIAALEAALDLYRSDTGHYPILSFWMFNEFWWHLEEGLGEAGWNGPYMHFDSDRVDWVGCYEDPWGNNYLYFKGGVHNGSDYFDLWSCGPDGRNDWGGNDDITNW